MQSWLIVGGVIAVVVIYIIVIYNRLVALRNRYENALSQIDVQLQRRYDLIPNLVETAKAYIKHERETLEAVIAARNQASQASSKVADQPGDGKAMRQLMGAEAALGGAMGKFFALAEAYPDLKADQTMAQLNEELASTENRISFARQGYNDFVMSYNTQRESFPDLIFAGLFRFDAADLWELEAPVEARTAPRVRF